MSKSLLDILEQINKDHSDFSTQNLYNHYKDLFKNFLGDISIQFDGTTPDNFILSRADYFFYRLIRTHHASRHEEQYKIFTRIFNFFRENYPSQYISLLQNGFKTIREYTLENCENKFSIFGQLLLQQCENFEPKIGQDSVVSKFFIREILFSLFDSEKCIQRFSKMPVEEQKSYLEFTTKYGGEEPFYDKRNKWPLPTMAQDAKDTLPILISFLVTILRKINKKNVSKEQAINDLFEPISQSQKYVEFKKEINDLITAEWDSQDQNESKLRLQLLDSTPLDNNTVALTADYLLPQPPKLFTVVFSMAQNATLNRSTSENNATEDEDNTAENNATEKAGVKA